MRKELTLNGESKHIPLVHIAHGLLSWGELLIGGTVLHRTDNERILNHNDSVHQLDAGKTGIQMCMQCHPHTSFQLRADTLHMHHPGCGGH